MKIWIKQQVVVARFFFFVTDNMDWFGRMWHFVFGHMYQDLNPTASDCCEGVVHLSWPNPGFVHLYYMIYIISSVWSRMRVCFWCVYAFMCVSRMPRNASLISWFTHTWIHTHVHSGTHKSCHEMKETCHESESLWRKWCHEMKETCHDVCRDMSRCEGDMSRCVYVCVCIPAHRHVTMSVCIPAYVHTHQYIHTVCFWSHVTRFEYNSKWLSGVLVFVTCLIHCVTLFWQVSFISWHDVCHKSLLFRDMSPSFRDTTCVTVTRFHDMSHSFRDTTCVCQSVRVCVFMCV